MMDVPFLLLHCILIYNDKENTCIYLYTFIIKLKLMFLHSNYMNQKEKKGGIEF
jgi:hypothetical protein